MLFESTHSKAKKRKNEKIQGKPKRVLGNSKQIGIQIMEITEIEALYDDIIINSFPSLERNRKWDLQSPRYPIMIRPKRSTSRFILAKLAKLGKFEK